MSNSSFITVDSGAAGSNNGTVNSRSRRTQPAQLSRSEHAPLLGRTETITQDAAPTANNDTATTNEDRQSTGQRVWQNSTSSRMVTR